MHVKGSLIPVSTESAGTKFHHFLELDGFRGLAILLVIVGHTLEKDLGIMTDLGSLGVLLFFVLSGFLITGLLDREQVQSGQISLSAFYTRRILRIFPASFFYIGVLSVLIGGHLVTDTPWYSVAACLLFVRNIWGRGSGTGHIWSLSLEEQFYAIWPWVLKRAGAGLALRIAVVGVVGVTVFRMICIHNAWLAHGFARTYYYRPWFRFDAILVGCVVALWMSRSGGLLPGRSVLSSPMVAMSCWPALVFWTIKGESLSPIWHLTVQTALALVVFLNLIVSKGSVIQSVFSVSLLRWFGKISYSWYIWQQLFTQYSDPAWGGLRTFPLNIVASLALAALSFAVIERPFLKLKDRMRGWRSVHASCR